jgi:hypothetical protein
VTGNFVSFAKQEIPMKKLLLIILLVNFACQNEKRETVITTETDTLSLPKDPITVIENNTKPVNAAKTYANERFRNVHVIKLDDTKFRIKGEGQIFEASFNWVVEDGHNELAKGYTMTDAGAPEWGKFNFTVDVKKERENSTLNLILFEASAKDGSRQHELPVVLE